ncbi:MAG: sulfite exporter TauE/SafE [Enterobacterales bacterium]|jgi:sulfite exporter TauE/SafE
MTFETMLFSALIAGLFGSLHCVGMCGGIASALGMSLKQSESLKKPTITALFYQVGRISSYFIAGFIAGSFGDILTQSEVLKNIATYLRLFSALFMVGLGFYLAGLFPFFTMIEKMGIPLWKKIAPLSKHLLPVENFRQAYSLGFLWGWLPCGLTYSILLWSIAAGSALEGGLLMLAFGLGTLPAMLPVTVGAGRITTLVKQPVIRQFAALIIILAGLFVLSTSFQMLNSTHQHSTDQAEAVHRH